MDLTFSAEEEAFRSELRSWLTANIPAGWDDDDFPTLADEVRFLVDWQRRMASGGWVGVHWPREFGGRGATTTENYILQEELARARAPEVIGRIGVNLVGPTLIHHGTEAQKRRHLARILAADELWCQLFSEPNAGSDLASLKTRAEDRGDHFEVNGQKIWTSYGAISDWGLLLARTDTSVPKHRGISCFLINMRQPGVDVRPLKQVTGNEEFCEVFMTSARVEKSDLVGRL